MPLSTKLINEAGAKLSTRKPIQCVSFYHGHITPLQKDNSALKAYFKVLAISVWVVQIRCRNKTACLSTPPLQTRQRMGQRTVPKLSRVVPTKQRAGQINDCMPTVPWPALSRSPRHHTTPLPSALQHEPPRPHPPMLQTPAVSSLPLAADPVPQLPARRPAQRASPLLLPTCPGRHSAVSLDYYEVHRSGASPQHTCVALRQASTSVNPLNCLAPRLLLRA